MLVIQGLCIFVDAEGYWKTQKVPGSLEDDFNFPLIWIDIHLYYELVQGCLRYVDISYLHLVSFCHPSPA